MSRLKADLLLLLVALIWGGAFVAQKTAFIHIGACTFIAARFAISALLVFPFALRELQSRTSWGKLAESWWGLIALCSAFSAAVLLQQMGLSSTSVTNAGFLTGLYVIFVPVLGRLLYKQQLHYHVFAAALLSLAGTWLLSGQNLTHLGTGDFLVILCALGFALQVAMIGRIASKTKAPLCLSFLQYIVVTLIAFAGALFFEHPSQAELAHALWPILYAGVLSGGLAYTLQAVAQQHTPSADAAIIMSGEGLFAALAGAVILNERLTHIQYAGCLLITLAIVMTEALPIFLRRKGG